MNSIETDLEIRINNEMIIYFKKLIYQLDVLIASKQQEIENLIKNRKKINEKETTKSRN